MGKDLYKDNHNPETAEVNELPAEQSSHTRVVWSMHQDVTLTSDDDTNMSVSENDWETISDYYSESEEDSLPGFIVRSLVDSDSDDDYYIKIMEDSLSDDGF